MIEITASRSLPARVHEASLELLRRAAAQRYPDTVDITIERSEHGKPFIAELPDFHFNISHSGEWCVLAVGDCPVGVDIQQLRPVRPDLARRFFTRRENYYLLSLPSGERTEAMIRMWTKKEAAAKASGEGLCRILSGLNTIAFDGTWSPLVNGWYTRTVPFRDPGYILSAASREQFENNPEVIYLTTDPRERKQ